MDERLSITIDPEIMSGEAVFAGTRVPVDTLFRYLIKGVALDEFLDCFPSVRRQDAVRVLEHAQRFLSAPAFHSAR